MTSSLRFAQLVVPVALALAAAACSDASSDASSPSSSARPSSPAIPAEPSPAASSSASRAIAEADITQLVGGRLFAISKSGSVSIIDVSRPGRLVMLGQAWVPGEPFEMYLRGDQLVVMTNGAYATSGQLQDAPKTASDTSRSTDRDSAAVLVLDVSRPEAMRRLATFPVPGEISDSRLVQSVLYLVTEESGQCWSCGTGRSTRVTTFDLGPEGASPSSALRQIDQITLPSSVDGWDASTWKRSVVATAERLYIGGHPNLRSGGGEGEIDVVDITDPSGKLARGAHLTTVGAITNRWQMDETDGVFRVVSQAGVGTQNGVGSPVLETFHVWNPRSLQPMGKLSIRLPRQESLKAVRFDGPRAYAITFAETDPLFVLDLSNEAAPKQRGELVMPGFVVHLEPHGDRLLGLGVDRRDPQGPLNVSLFDVADLDRPKMLKRVSFGDQSPTTNDELVTYAFPEDQSRLQKAFRYLPQQNLIVMPFSNETSWSCGASGAVQLIEWRGGALDVTGRDTLEKQAELRVAGPPRRAIMNETTGELFAISDTKVTSFDLARRDASLQTAELVIGTCDTVAIPDAMPRTPTETPTPTYANDSYYRDDVVGPFGCSATGTFRSSWAGMMLAGLGLVGIARRRRARAEF